MLDSASIVCSTAARLVSTLAMAGDVMSILREVEFSLTAELIADWVCIKQSIFQAHGQETRNEVVNSASFSAQ